MASPKVEILLSLAKAEAVKSASSVGNEIADNLNKGLGSIRLNATLELFNKLLNMAKKFYSFVAENNEHVREMGEAMSRSMNEMGKALGQNAGQNKQFIEAMKQATNLVNQLGVSAASGAGAMGVFISLASAAVSLTAKLATNIIGGIDDMMRMVGLAKEVSTTLSGAAFTPTDSAVRKESFNPFKQKRLVPREEDVMADEEKRKNEQKKLRESRLREAQARDREEIAARNSLLDAELEELRAADAQKELLAEREADRNQHQLELKFQAIADIGKAGEDEILIIQERDAFLAQLADNRLLSEEERYRREQSIRESAGKALETLEQKKMREEAKRVEAKRLLMQQYANVVSSGMAGAVIEAARGQESLGEIMKKAAGGIMTTIGSMLIQMGTAAVLAGTIGTVIPLFKPATGGEMGVTAGLAAIAGGVAMVAAGGALSASASSSAKGAPRTGMAIPRNLDLSASTSSLNRLTPEAIPTNQGPAQTINVHFNQGFVVGSPERVASAVQGALNANQPGQLGWVGPT